MKTRSILLVLICILSISCSKKETIEKTYLSELDLYQQLWESKGIDSYSFTQRISCFCSQEYTRPNYVVVQNGVVVSVEGVPFDASMHQAIFSVDTRFDFLRQNLVRDPDEFSVEYDPSLGFPMQFYFDFDYQMADEEVGYTFTDFTVLRPE